jgi:hypothetical protein
MASSNSSGRDVGMELEVWVNSAIFTRCAKYKHKLCKRGISEDNFNYNDFIINTIQFIEFRL